MLNRHHRATQALVALNGKPTVVLVGPSDVDFSDEAHLDRLRAFLCDGSAGINLALGTWHAGPYPLADHVDLVNVQGAQVMENDVEEAHLDRDLALRVGKDGNERAGREVHMDDALAGVLQDLPECELHSRQARIGTCRGARGR